MNRRQFITASALLGATGFASSALSMALPRKGALPDGPVTLYYEFRLAEPENAAAIAAVQAQAAALNKSTGFLSLALKQMTGDSTMVKNYPESYKGVLAEAYLDGVRDKTQPYFYALFIRFADYESLLKSTTEQWFDDSVVPHLYGYAITANGPVKSPAPMAHYRGIFQSIVAGNRNGIYYQPQEITKFLSQAVDEPAKGMITVGNHVMIHDEGHEAWEKQVSVLLKVAQETYQPSDEANATGLPGARDNNHYRKAVSTEILRNAFPDGGLRAYLMHGVWESVWDHENSHLDPRFKQGSAPVGMGVVIGPVEPFYQTRVLAVRS
jgi:hypothetical protein